MAGSSYAANSAESNPPTGFPAWQTRRIPLEFWLGPFLLLQWHFRVAFEHFYPGPEAAAAPPAPDFGRLSNGECGVYRRSQPLPPGTLPASVPGWIAYTVDRHERRLIDLRQTFEEYIRHFSRKARTRVKAEVRRFREAVGGSIDWRVYRSVAEMEEFHRLARDISQHTYQEKLFDRGMPAGPKALETIRQLAAADQARGYILFWQGLPISYVYCSAVGSRLDLAYLGFRPEFAKHSPGTVLMFLALESLFAEQRFAVMDLFEGEGLHKRVFATHAIPSAHVFYLRRTIGNRVVVTTHHWWRHFSEVAVNLLERVGAKQRLRQWIRGQRPAAEKHVPVEQERRPSAGAMPGKPR